MMIAGTIGTYTGLKPGAFSINLNQRAYLMDSESLMENIVMTFSGYLEASWLIRKTLVECESFDCAYKSFRENKITALAYLILAGTKDEEGVIISRSRTEVVNETRLNATEGRWYLVQTNNDQWDSGCHNRCLTANENMQNIT